MNTIQRLRSGAALAAGVTAVVLFHSSAAFAQSEMGPEELASHQPARAAVSMVLPESVGELLQYLSVDYHFANIARGVLDTRDVLFYLSLTAVGLALTTRTLGNVRQ